MEKGKGNLSKVTRAALEDEKREVIKDWIASGKIESENGKDILHSQDLQFGKHDTLKKG